MKWKHQEPKEGDARTRVIFALWPRVCSDGYVRWLERVKVRETYDTRHYDMDGCGYGTWEEIAVTAL